MKVMGRVRFRGPALGECYDDPDEAVNAWEAYIDSRPGDPILQAYRRSLLPMPFWDQNPEPLPKKEP